MVHQMLTVFDNKTLAYLVPFYSQSKPAAIRSIADCINEEGHPFNKHPEDYTLFELGLFDDTQGSFSLLASPMAVANLHELVNQEGS